MDFTVFNLPRLDPIEMGGSGFCKEPYLLSTGSTGFLVWTRSCLLGFTGFSWVFLGFNSVLAGRTELEWVSLALAVSLIGFHWLFFYTRTCEVVYFIFFGGFEMGRNGPRLTRWVVPVNGGAAC